MGAFYPRLVCSTFVDIYCATEMQKSALPSLGSGRQSG